MKIKLTLDNGQTVEIEGSKEDVFETLEFFYPLEEDDAKEETIKKVPAPYTPSPSGKWMKEYEKKMKELTECVCYKLGDDAYGKPSNLCCPVHHSVWQTETTRIEYK